MGILFSVSFVVLNKPAAKTTDEFAQVPGLHPALTTKFFSVIHSEHYLALYSV